MCADADAGLTNGGGIRGDTVYPAGSEITGKLVLTEPPFGNRTVKLALSGARIRQALEHGVGNVENASGAFPHVSGLTFSFDASRPKGRRVVEVAIGGAPLENELTTLQAVLKRPDLFPDKEEPGKGRFFSCPSGWACQIINGNLFEAYGLKKAGFVSFDPGSGEGLAAAIAKAYERKEPFFGYYWAPTSILGKYPMVRVKGMTHDPATWKCLAKPDCTDPKPYTCLAQDEHIVGKVLWTLRRMRRWRRSSASVA